MTLLKPGMKATYKLPDGSMIELTFDKVAVPDPSTAAPPEPKPPAQQQQ